MERPAPVGSVVPVASGEVFVGEFDTTVVSVAADAVSAPVEITVVGVDVPSREELSSIPGVVVAYTGVEVVLSGGDLIGDASVTFALPDGFDHETLIPIVVWESADGDGWEFLDTEVDVGAGTITAVTDHFSTGWFGSIDASRLVEPLRAWVADLVFGRAGADHPSCGDERSPRDAGFEVTSHSGDLVMWCFGREDGRDVLKVTNNWRAAQQVSYLSSWQATGFDGAGVNLQGLYDWLATAGLSSETVTRRLIPPGGTIVLEPADITPDEWSLVVVEPSVGSWAWSGALLGVDVLLAVYGKFFDDELSDRAKAALTTAKFAECFTSHYGADAARAVFADTAADAQSMFDTVVEALKFGLVCGQEFIVAALEDMNVGGFVTRIVGVVAVAVGIAVGLVATALAGTRLLFDDVKALFTGGRLSTDGYAIGILFNTKPAVTEQMIANMRLADGTCGWLGEDAGLQLTDGSTGVGPVGEEISVFVDAGSDAVMFADFDGDGVGDALILVECFSGNSLWSDLVVVVAGEEPRRLGEEMFVSVPEVPSGAYVARFGSVTAVGERVRVRWTGSRENDLRCCPSLEFESFLVFGDGGFTVAETVLRDDYGPSG